MIVLSPHTRRALLLGCLSSLSANRQGLSFQEAINFLINHCPTEYLHAVVKTGGRFLYRGEALYDDKISILAPAPDLFDLDTYSDPQAVAFFECLESRLERTNIRPSQAHIATATRSDAESWGSPVSVWPLGVHFAYLWPKNQTLFYPGSCRQTLVLNDDLSTALREGKEVMFTSNYHSQIAYLAFPGKYDKELERIFTSDSLLPF